MKQFLQNQAGWYAVMADNHIVIATSKELPFEFSVTQWYQLGELYLGLIKAGY